jgi:2-polyprenyl-6-methoxyphenol hydroxylase-like FAD-dependent oxidoreductase
MVDGVLKSGPVFHNRVVVESGEGQYLPFCKPQCSTKSLDSTHLQQLQREPIWIGQNRLEGILCDALQKYSCEVEFGTTLVSLTQDANGVHATIAKGDGKEETQRFEFLVGADGARGVVRSQLGLIFLGESRPGDKAIIGDIHVEGLGQDASRQFFPLATG